MITADGCWADFHMSDQPTRNRPCLFLDRDGILIEDTGYPHIPADVVLIHESLAAVAEAQQAGFVTGIVSNQSGVGRGLFDWEAFAAVQALIDDALRQQGAKLDFVLACPHHPEAAIFPFRADHAWRKPQPGMLLAAQDRFGLDLRESIMLGDRTTDMQAAVRAGVAHRLKLDSVAKHSDDADGVVHVTRPDVGATIRALAQAWLARPATF